MSDFINTIERFYEINTEISIAIAVAIVLALVIKPKAAGKIAGAMVVIAIVGYLIVEVVNLTGNTMDRKSEAAKRTDRQYQDSEQQSE